ncbi:MAG TPA: CehA/McbA family metallohydrolase [Gemmatimonadales bacterium]|nr:CehA/McbA family metallohydrolase [Gemmatimonadales bacterium]
MGRRVSLGVALIVGAHAAPLPTIPCLDAQRQGVLQQVDLPHAYYWREMYVPQVTSGPSSATWSPDGTELIYSMQGTLWRQRIGSDVAQQLTAGPGYDYQPDWSPDGRSVVFARYAQDAIELELLDISSGKVTALTNNRAVNVEPRWSPDGTRIAFVSSIYNRRWHIHVLSHEVAKDSLFGEPVRLTADNDSKLPRYYYSRWDHYISPTWSPDGSEIILVSNRGHIHGTGGFWRMAAQPGAPMRELRYEETTWKARPDWSPDGKRVVYSSYLGRQWNQLWLMTSDGGDPFPLSYGEFDATAPRWSRDGSRIAYISNERDRALKRRLGDDARPEGRSGAGTSLWIIDVPGGKRQQIEVRERRYRDSVGTLRVEVVDNAGRPLAARISVITAAGRGYAPDDAWRHADEAFDRSERQFEYSYFHSTGLSELTVPAGQVHVEVWHGPEYRVFRADVNVPTGMRVTRRVVLKRIDNLPARGWWSGDVHVHMNYGGAYRNTPPHLAFQARAEDLHVVENLIVNKEQRIPDIGYFRVGPDPVSSATFLLMHAQEFHTSVWGHMGLLHLQSHYLIPEYAGYPNTPAASLYPDNAAIADLAHEEGALVGYVHPFDTRPDLSDTSQSLSSELPVDVALGKVDYIEVMGYSDHLITSEIWYRLLNCGFRMPAGAGTDAFPNFASLRGPPGLVRVFVKSGATLDHNRWLAALKAGRTFVTNAPLLEFSLAGHQIGDEITLPAGSHRLSARVSVRSSVPVGHLEIIGNGKIVATIPLRGDRTRATDTVSIPVSTSGWYVLRAYSDRAELPVLDLYPFASTSPIYVTVAGAPVRSPEDAEFFMRWIGRLEQLVDTSTAWNTPAERATVLRALADARAVFTAQVPQR